MASRDFQQELHAQIERAIERGAEQLIVNSGELLAAVGGRPVLKHQMWYCCDVMREEMKAGDAVVDGPENGNGPSLTIRYLLSGSSERGCGDHRCALASSPNNHLAFTTRGAKISAEHARQQAKEAAREADRAELRRRLTSECHQREVYRNAKAFLPGRAISSCQRRVDRVERLPKKRRR
jgi:hypothetical protein